MAKTGQEVLRCAYPSCENRPRPAEAGAAAEPGHCGPPDPGDQAAAHGADRAPTPSGAGPARWRDGPGPEDRAARGSRCGHIAALARGAASTPWLLPGRRARRRWRPMRGGPRRWRPRCSPTPSGKLSDEQLLAQSNHYARQRGPIRTRPQTRRRRIRCGPRITRLLRTVSGACRRQGGGGAADRTSAKAAKVTTVLSKRCRAVLTERRR